MGRIAAREKAFQLVFEHLFLLIKNETIMNELEESIDLEKSDLEYIKNVYNVYIENKEAIEEIMKPNIRTQISYIDKAILSLSICEIMFLKSDDTSLIINEAVELAKKYAAENSYKFIHAVLAKIVNGSKAD